MTTAAVHSGQVTVTVTSAPDGTGAATAEVTSSSTLSLIYIYSTSTSAQPTGVSSSSSNNNNTNTRRVSGGVIAGIVVSCIAFLVLMSLALFCYSRKLARKRRAEMAILHQSLHMAPSRAYSHATTGHGTMEERKPDQSSHYARSIGGISAVTGTETIGTTSMSLNSPTPMPSRPPPAELPTSHHPKNARVVDMRRPKTGVAEMYGNYAHPVELQAGSTTNLVTIKSGEKRMKASGSSEGRRSDRDRRDSDVESRGYMSPEPEWHSSGRRGSDGAETEYGTEYGNGDGASIHIYYRSSAATIAQAISQASFSKATSTKASTRTSSAPFMSQTSLMDSTR